MTIRTMATGATEILGISLERPVFGLLPARHTLISKIDISAIASCDFLPLQQLRSVLPYSCLLDWSFMPVIYMLVRGRVRIRIFHSCFALATTYYGSSQLLSWTAPVSKGSMQPTVLYHLDNQALIERSEFSWLVRGQLARDCLLLPDHFSAA